MFPMLSSFFKRKVEVYGEVLPLEVDMHSHLLPNLDDGADSLDEAVRLVEQFVKMGYKKLITTPHVMEEFYPNTPQKIQAKVTQLNEAISQLGWDIHIQGAAEYYLDEYFIERLRQKETLLSFGKKKYVLFETAFLNASPYFNEAVFLLQSQGYTPVLAHPERYQYLYNDFGKLKDIANRGVLLQTNINALVGCYNIKAKEVAEKLIDNNMVSFIASDCHGKWDIAAMKECRQTPAFKKALKLDLLNNTL